MLTQLLTIYYCAAVPYRAAQKLWRRGFGLLVSYNASRRVVWILHHTRPDTEEDTLRLRILPLLSASSPTHAGKVHKLGWLRSTNRTI